MSYAFVDLLEQNIFNLEMRDRIIELFRSFKEGEIDELKFVGELKEIATSLLQDVGVETVPDLLLRDNIRFMATVTHFVSRTIIYISTIAIKELPPEVSASGFLFELGIYYLTATQKQVNIFYKVRNALSILMGFLFTGSGLLVMARVFYEIFKAFSNSQAKTSVDNFFSSPSTKKFIRYLFVVTLISIGMFLFWTGLSRAFLGKPSKDMIFVYKLGLVSACMQYFQYTKNVTTMLLFPSKIVNTIVSFVIKNFSPFSVNRSTQALKPKAILNAFGEFYKRHLKEKTNLTPEEIDLLSKEYEQLKKSVDEKTLNGWVGELMEIVGRVKIKPPPTVGQIEFLGKPE